jgi:hypothetical protein
VHTLPAAILKKIEIMPSKSDVVVMIQNDTLSINQYGKPVQVLQKLMKIIENMIRTIGFRPEGRNPNYLAVFRFLQNFCKNLLLS